MRGHKRGCKCVACCPKTRAKGMRALKKWAKAGGRKKNARRKAALRGEMSKSHSWEPSRRGRQNPSPPDLGRLSDLELFHRRRALRDLIDSPHMAPADLVVVQRLYLDVAREQDRRAALENPGGPHAAKMHRCVEAVSSDSSVNDPGAVCARAVMPGRRKRETRL